MVLFDTVQWYPFIRHHIWLVPCGPHAQTGCSWFGGGQGKCTCCCFFILATEWHARTYNIQMSCWSTKFFSIWVMLSSQNHPFRPCMGCMQWLLHQASTVSFFSFSFFVHISLRAYIYKTGTCVVFIVDRHVRDGTWEPGGPALTWLSHNLFSQTNTKSRIYCVEKCYW